MFLSDWRLLLRRWYVVVVGLLATVLLCFLATRLVPTKYEATSGLLLLPPRSTAEGVPDNPFLSLGGLDTVSGVVARAATDRVMQQEVAKAGGTGSYTVEPDLASGGPVLLITVDDVTAEGALTTLQVVSQRLPALLTSLQTSSGVKNPALIRSRELIRDDVAQPIRKPLIRALLVALAGGLAGTVLLASLVDGFMLRRSTRDEPEADSGATVDGSVDRAADSGVAGRSWSDDRNDRPGAVVTPLTGTTGYGSSTTNGTARANGSYGRSAPDYATGGGRHPVPARPLAQWAPPIDPDPTVTIAYGTSTDPDPTVEIAYDRLSKDLSQIRSETGRSEPG